MTTTQANDQAAIYRQARRQSGLARFERNCGCKIYEGRRRKAYLIPGTQENGKWAMLKRRFIDIADEIKAAQVTE